MERDDDPQGLMKGLTNYGDTAFSLFLRKAFIKGAGYQDDALSRPIIGIANTGSGYNPCHGNAPQLIEAIRRGVMLAGGLPMDFPTISIHESFAFPTSMYLRNLMAIDTEELLRAQPMDAVVLIGGCDKTVPAQLMGAASADIPTIELVTGSMLTGAFRGERVGACTDCRRFWGMYRGNEIDADEIRAVNDHLVASVGTCAVMGTASTMACITEALGLMPAGGASPPAVTADRIRIAEQTGRMAVGLAQRRQTFRQTVSAASLENAFTVLFAIGGSTNGIIHLTAIAGRLGIAIDLEKLDAISRNTPVLVDLKPSGQHYMEDFHRAGGVVTLMRQLAPLLHLDAMTVSGKTLGEVLEEAPPSFPQDVIRPFDSPIYPEGGIAVLHGNLAPRGAIIKQSAASKTLMEHEGRAVVFENLEDLAARIDDDNLDVEENDVLVLRQIGPVGAPGMPEAGYIPIPRKLARRGVKDMVRLSDGRISGTVAGTVIVHVTPEAARGGPIALIQTGDRIRLSVSARSLELLVSDAVLEARRVSWESEHAEGATAPRGYRKLFLESVTQADQGCDFDFLREPETVCSVPGG